MAGTNDMASNSAAAVGQLGTLIDSIFTRCPDAALIVSTLIPLSFAQTQVNTYNQAVRGLVSTRAAAGKHILLADMSPVLSSDLADGVHPNNAGYVKMANVWFPVVQQAARNGWIGTPV
jgi:lysophospholipase L1-like esterase